MTFFDVDVSQNPAGATLFKNGVGHSVHLKK